MKIASENLTEIHKGPIAPFHPQKALIGVRMDDYDTNVLKYLGYFASVIPMDTARFVHVIPYIYLFDKHDGSESKDFEKYGLDEEVADKLAAVIATQITSKSKVKVEFEVRDGDPLDELIQSAEKEKSDLIVIGKSTKRGRHGILAKNFARRVKSNALVIPDKARSAMKKILVPVDFSPNSIEALRAAVAVCKCFNKPPVIMALNVYELPIFQTYLVRKSLDEMREILMEDRQAAFKSFLDNFIPDEDRHLIKTDIIEQTHPGTGSFIVDYAEGNKYNLIVMGAKGHSKVGLLLMGSVTEKVLSDIKHTPVLVVK